MNTSKLNNSLEIKCVEPRYILLKENVYDALDPFSLKVYLAIKFFAQYGTESSSVKRSIKSIMEKANQSRAQVFRSLNKLEVVGLLRRSSNLGETNTISVATTLGYFNDLEEKERRDKEIEKPVSEIDGVVPDRDTYHYFLSLVLNTISDFKKSPIENSQEVVKEEEIIQAYHETLPESPKVRVVDKKLSQQLKGLVKNWPKYQPDGESFTLQSFKRFLLAIKRTNPGFMKPYMTASGNRRQNNLRTFTREVNIAKLLNGEFNFSGNDE